MNWISIYIFLIILIRVYQYSIMFFFLLVGFKHKIIWLWTQRSKSYQNCEPTSDKAVSAYLMCWTLKLSRISGTCADYTRQIVNSNWGMSKTQRVHFREKQTPWDLSFGISELQRIERVQIMSFCLCTVCHILFLQPSLFKDFPIRLLLHVSRIIWMKLYL